MVTKYVDELSERFHKHCFHAISSFDLDFGIT